MEQQLKQRLVGAAVLVSIAILVVPVLLDGGYRRAAPPTRDMAPMPQDSFEDVVAPLPPDVKQALEAGLDADPDELANAAAEAAAALDTPQVSAPAFVDEAAPPAPEAAPVPPPPSPKPVADTKPAPSPKPVPTPAPAAATPAAEQWTVQLGSFASRTNAESLLARVKASGAGGFILPLTDGGKTSYRVRAGPVGGRAAADRLRQDLERSQGIRGMLVRYP